MGKYDGIALASGCIPCTGTELSGGTENHGGLSRMAVIHTEHVGYLVAKGWVLTEYPEPDEPPDVVCPHYAKLCRDYERDHPE